MKKKERKVANGNPLSSALSSETRYPSSPPSFVTVKYNFNTQWGLHLENCVDWSHSAGHVSSESTTQAYVPLALGEGEEKIKYVLSSPHSFLTYSLQIV